MKTKKVVLVLFGCFLCPIVCLVVIANVEPMHPEMRWHVQGTVLDESKNAVSNASVAIVGVGKVTVLNQMFSIAPRGVNLAAMTGSSGKFDFDFIASGFGIGIESADEPRQIFNCPSIHGKETNVNITLVLKSRRKKQ